MTKKSIKKSINTNTRRSKFSLSGFLSLFRSPKPTNLTSPARAVDQASIPKEKKRTATLYERHLSELESKNLRILPSVISVRCQSQMEQEEEAPMSKSKKNSFSQIWHGRWSSGQPNLERLRDFDRYFLEQSLVATKLKLANVQTDNDHYSQEVKNMKRERDLLEKKHAQMKIQLKRAKKEVRQYKAENRNSVVYQQEDRLILDKSNSVEDKKERYAVRGKYRDPYRGGKSNKAA